MKDTLYMLPPGFADNNRREYCPECAEIWGLLSWYPAIKESLDIVYLPIEKPRADLVNLLGVANQNGPTLILSNGSPDYKGSGIQSANGHRFIDNARDMGVYYARRFGTAWPRGHQPA